jgi:hypothetical protein
VFVRVCLLHLFRWSYPEYRVENLKLSSKLNFLMYVLTYRVSRPFLAPAQSTVKWVTSHSRGEAAGS